MKLIDINEIAPTGAPLYDMRGVFETKTSGVKLSVIEIAPHSRVPASGWGKHETDEYSIFISGEVYTESGEYKGVVGAGKATLIPRGEEHWCENRSDKPCRIVCMMAE